MPARLFALALSLTGLSFAQNPTQPRRPTEAPVYYEGSIWVLEYSRLREGAAEQYLEMLADDWQVRLDRARGEGIILSYKVLLGTAADRHDWDLMTMIELRNLAALDGLAMRLGALSMPRRLTPEEAALREVIGTKIVREALLRPAR